MPNRDACLVEDEMINVHIHIKCYNRCALNKCLVSKILFPGSSFDNAQV